MTKEERIRYWQRHTPYIGQRVRATLNSTPLKEGGIYTINGFEENTPITFGKAETGIKLKEDADSYWYIYRFEPVTVSNEERITARKEELYAESI